MADYIRPTPRNPFLGGLADLLEASTSPERTQQMQGIMSMLGVPAVASTLNRMSYGAPLTSGAGGLGGTTRVLPDVLDAALAVAPMAGPAARMTKGLPVGASIKNAGGKLKVKPPTDDIYDVMDASFKYGKLGGNKNIPIEKLSGGVRMSDPEEAKRVKELANKISGADGYISRIIVDEKGNVIEGQHRLEALRLLGRKDVPVAVIEDLSNKYNISAMEKALEGKLRSDNVSQMIKRAIDAIEESGSADKALSDYIMPAQFQKPFEDVLKASTKPTPTPAFQYPQEEALRLAQQRAALPVEQYGLGLPAGNTAAQRAAAMGFDPNNPMYHATDVEFQSIRPSNAGKMGAGVYVSPSSRYAEKYAGEGARVLPLLTRGQLASDDVAMDIAESIRQKMAAQNPDFSVPEWKRQTTQAIEDAGYAGRNFSGLESVITNPENIRSRFAAFDPFRRNAAIATATGALAPDLLAAQEDEAMRQRQLGLMGTLAP